jgi:hypothetical protein
VISAIIPDNYEDPLLLEIVTKNMIHDPRGILKPNSRVWLVQNALQDN